MKKLTLEYVKDQIENVLHKGSKLLSKEYINDATKLKIQCEHKHIFEITWNNINNKTHNRWCKKCGIIKRSKKIRNSWNEVYNKIIKLHPNYKILSTEKDYINRYSKLKIICDDGHNFISTWNKINTKPNNCCCPICKGINTSNRCRNSWDKVYNNIIELQPNCKILSTRKDYINNESKLEIICENGHKFKISYSNLSNKTKRWCPYCKHKTEQKVREIFEKLTNKKFLSTRSIIKIPKKYYYIKCLELDGYNDKLKTGFEYNGEQHYNKNYFNINKTQTLKEIQKRDKIRKQLCEEQGINLIIIPYWEKNNLENYIKNELIKIYSFARFPLPNA